MWIYLKRVVTSSYSLSVLCAVAFCACLSRFNATRNPRDGDEKSGGKGRNETKSLISWVRGGVGILSDVLVATHNNR